MDIPLIGKENIGLDTMMLHQLRKGIFIPFNRFQKLLMHGLQSSRNGLSFFCPAHDGQRLHKHAHGIRHFCRCTTIGDGGDEQLFLPGDTAQHLGQSRKEEAVHCNALVPA